MTLDDMFIFQASYKYMLKCSTVYTYYQSFKPENKQKVVFKGLTSYQVDKIMLAAHSPTLYKTIHWAKISVILFILLLCF